MHVSSNEFGLCIRGQIAHITLPLLMGLLERGGVTGDLRVEGESATCLISWGKGSVVGLQWGDEPLTTEDTKERAMVSLLVKQSSALFAQHQGNYTFESAAIGSVQQVRPGRLPLAFFIRYGLASTSFKELTHILFDTIFPSQAQVVLRPESQLKILGSKAESLLAPYQEKTKVVSSQVNDNMRQLFMALWSVSQLDIEPVNTSQQQFQKMLHFVSSDKAKTTRAKELATLFGPTPLAEEDLITEIHGSNDSYVGLLPPTKEGKAGTLKAPLKMPEISEGLHEAINGRDAIASMLGAMEEWKASDLLLSQGKAPAARINGQVIVLPLPPTDISQFDTFLIGSLGENARRRFQESGDLDMGYSLTAERRFRINLHKQKGLLGLVARAIPSGNLSFEDLGLPEALEVLASQPRGLLLVTGATGSGKSTTLAAMINYINSTRHTHIVTIEEPIEFVHQEQLSRITQREVGIDTESFHTALRHVVRESPDVILIGEMRDMETMQVALSAALTGHLVLASLHTVDAVQTLQRIMSYFPEDMRHQVAMDLSLSLRGVVSQRLLPTRKGDRRVAAIEILTCTPAAAQLLRQQRIEELSDHLKSNADEHSQSFNRSLLNLYRKGVITYEMGRAYATNPEEFSLSAQGMETGVAAFRTDDDGEVTAGLDIKSLLQVAIDKGASDLHLTTGRPPILRIVGRLKPLPFDPLTEGDMRLLLFSILSVRQRTIYQLEKEIDFALALDDGKRFRVNAYFQKGKMAAALRAIPSHIPDPDDLGIPEQIMITADHPHGLVLVVGPTGSGKSTTLACMLDRINTSRACRIVTIEDPIEFTHVSKKSTIDQREVYADTKSFGSALKYILRQDPDVILVGEMRDMETISAALTAAETGHLVLATLHTNNAIQTIARIIDVYPAHQQPQIRSQLASSLVGVISQRLLRRSDMIGRIAAFELMLASPAIRNLIREDKMHQARSIMESSRSMGMLTMDYALQELYQQGKVSMEAAMQYITNPQLLTQESSQKSTASRSSSPYYR